MWWEVIEDDKAVGSPGTDGILQCEKPFLGTGPIWLQVCGG